MKKSQKHELRKHIGDLQSICGFKDYTFNDGPARGVRAFDLKNGKNIQMTILADRGLDISHLSYKGINMSFSSKVGIRSPHLYTENGSRGFLRQFNAGMLTTCGITYAGAAGDDNGRELGLHGPYSNLPAEQICAEMIGHDDDILINVRGLIRESCVFSENMLLQRSLILETEKDIVRIHDNVENQGFSKEPVMLVYHINFGYPMLDSGSMIYSSAGLVTPRDGAASKGMSKFDLMEVPGIERPEECFFHTDLPDNDAFVMLNNDKLKLAAIIRFDGKVFPLLCEWKCMRAGDYALGLEPTTSGVANRSIARENGTLTYLEPGDSREYGITLEFTDDPAVIGHYRNASGMARQAR